MPPRTSPSPPRPLGPLPPRPSAVDACTDALRAAILGGQYPPGARLPPERELAERLGVNRLTLRNALGQLVAAGLLTVRQGSGYVVQDYQRRGGADLLAPLYALARTSRDRRAFFADLLHVRRALARAAMELLEERMSTDALARIERAVDAFGDAVKAGAPAAELAERDRDVVQALVAGTRSPVLALTVNPVFNVLQQLPDLVEAMYAEPRLNVAGFRALVDALRSRAPSPGERVGRLLEGLDRALLERLPGGRSRRRGDAR